MEPGSLDTYVFLIVFFGFIIIGIIAMVERDGQSFWLYKKLRCKLRLHKWNKGFGANKTKKYRCAFCKKSRNHPKLKLIKGDKRDFKGDWIA